METRNRMSASALKKSENVNKIEFIKNPNTGKLFFACGSKQGYISPRVKEAYEKNELTLDKMDYCECSIDGETYVPCLMMHANSNVVAEY